MTIYNLASTDTVSSADQIPVYSQNSGDDRRVSVANFMSQIVDGSIPTGMLDISTLYVMRRTASTTQAVTTSYANIANYEANLSIKDGQTSLIANKTLGSFTLNRDVQAFDFSFSLIGSWPTNRDLTLALLIGDNTNPFESAFKYVGTGKGNGVQVTASITGQTANLNNVGWIAKAGETIRVVAKFNVADTLNIDRVAFVVRPLDGV